MPERITRSLFPGARNYSFVRRRVMRQLMALTISIVLPNCLYAEVLLVKTGSAIPGLASERGNIERLRERALRNAMEQALQEVSGTFLETERLDQVRSSETSGSKDGEAYQTTTQSDNFRNSNLTRLGGFVRVDSVLKEWQNSDRYYVSVRLAVETPAEVEQRKNAAYYWNRAGRPAIVVLQSLPSQGPAGNSSQLDFPDFARSVLVRNGMLVSDVATEGTHYKILVEDHLQSKGPTELGNYTSHCNVSFHIVSIFDNTIAAEGRMRAGPKAGFTREDAGLACARDLSDKFAMHLIRKLTYVVNDDWVNGYSYRLLFRNLPAEEVNGTKELLERVFRLTRAEIESYADGVLAARVTYAGRLPDLQREIVESMEERSYRMVVESIAGNKIVFVWTGKQRS